MIPKKLTISNFQSYGEEPQELDFDRFRIACLTGANAAGKSSLIEAMGWCIWGRGRTGKEGLINENATQMQVSCIFETSGKTYRIIRRAARKKNGGTTEQVDLHLYDPRNKSFKSLNESTLRLTQKKILDLVGLDYDAFISSSFISQGRSNEFSLKSPKERKEILAQILRIDRYASLAEKAREKTRMLGEEISYLSGRIGSLGDDISRSTQLHTAFEKVSLEAANAEKALTVRAGSCRELEERLSTMKERELEQKNIRIQLNRTESRIGELHLLLQKLQDEELDLRKLVDNREEIEKNSRKFHKLKQQLVRFDRLFQTVYELRQEELKLESAKKLKLQEARHRIETLETALKTAENEQRKLRGKITLLRNDRELLRKLRLEHEKTEASARLLETHLEEKDRCMRSLSSLESRLTASEARLEEIESKGTKLKSMTGTICPLCRSKVDDAHKERVLEEYREQYRGIEKQIKADRSEKKRLDASWQDLEKKQQELRTLQKQIQTLQHRMTGLEERLKTLEEFENSYAEAKKNQELQAVELNRARASFSSGAIVEHEFQQLSIISERVTSLDYRSDRHNALKTELEKLSEAENKSATLTMAVSRLDKLTGELHNSHKELESLKKHHETEISKLDELSALLDNKVELEKQLAAAYREKKTAEQLLQQFLVEKQSLKKTLDELAEKKKQREELSAELGKKEEEKNIFSILQEAFGIQGIQSLLIENAVPQLEEQANRILGKLTQNSMAFELQTQKQRINKNVTETLEIAISDSQGEVRDYDSFSGGEKFRIDLSLRIALSKLLSTQTGYGIKLLVIDEGFGTQDEEGLDAIIDSIHRITGEFEKIVLITHLEKLKDAFEVKIAVSRKPEQGSTFSLVAGDQADYPDQHVRSVE